ncbi:MAG: hypothetical protein ACO1N0_15960 [Fluviicola sp.]
MEHSVETGKRDGNKDRKMARIIAISSGVLVLTILSFIGYSISNPNVNKQTNQAEEEYVALDAQLLDPGTKESGAGNPAKTTKAETTPGQMRQVLTATNSDAHVKSGNSDITNTTDPSNQTSAAKQVSDNPFGTGGINGEKYGGSTGENPGWKDNQTEHTKPAETIKRYLVEKPNTTNIQSDENCKIVLSVLIDPNGTIVGDPAFVKNGSTTNDMSITNQVIKIVKNQARFNKVNTTKNTKELINIRITAN